MKKIILFVPLLILGMAVTSATADQVFTIYTDSQLPYFAYPEGGQPEGIFIEVVQSALRAKGMPFETLPELPWRRAQQDAAKAPNSLILLSRTALREPDWVWLALALNDKVVVVVPKGASGPNNVAELAHAASVGVKIGGAAESVAMKLGLDTKLDRGPTEKGNAQKMLLGRLPVWISQIYRVGQCIRDLPELKEYIEIRFIVQDSPLWVATSKNTSPENVAKLRAALEAFCKTDAYQQILHRYNGANLEVGITAR